MDQGFALSKEEKVMEQAESVTAMIQRMTWRDNG